MAIFTYQLAYYFWVRLEQNEIRSEMQGVLLQDSSTTTLLSSSHQNQNIQMSYI